MGAEAFEILLRKDKAAKRLSGRIREACLIRDHMEVIGRAREHWERSRMLDYMSPEHYVYPAFIHGAFSFPAEVMYPCLPIPHEKFGLQYVSSGTTTATAGEFLLAEDAGATINVIAAAEFPIVRDPISCRPEFTFDTFMKEFVNKREEIRKTNPIGGEIAKTINNSFYGKVAQATRPRKSLRPSTGRMVPIQRSPVSEPCSAALITGQVRACLSSILFSIEDFNREQRGKPESLRIPEIVVISATTDGCLIRLGKNPEIVAEGFYAVDDQGELEMKRGLTAESVLAQLGYKRLLEMMECYVPIHLLRAARYRLTGHPDFLEVKAVCDGVFALKTRLQFGWLASGATVIAAKGGHKPPIRQYIDEKAHDPTGVAKKTLERRWFEEQIIRKGSVHGRKA